MADPGGERGVGKLALARAVHQRRNPAAPFHVLDAAGGAGESARLRAELLSGTGMLVIRHVDELTVRQVRSLGAACCRRRGRPGSPGGCGWR